MCEACDDGYLAHLCGTIHTWIEPDLILSGLLEWDYCITNSDLICHCALGRNCYFIVNPVWAIGGYCLLVIRCLSISVLNLPRPIKLSQPQDELIHHYLSTPSSYFTAHCAAYLQQSISPIIALVSLKLPFTLSIFKRASSHLIDLQDKV